MRVLIIGGSSGIGAELARHYAARGDQLFVSGRNAERLAALCEGGRALPLLFDVRDEAQVRAAALQLAAHCSGLDLLIYAAGDCRYVDGGALTSAVVADMLDVNLLGAVRVLEAFRPLLAQGERPRIYLVSSAAVYFPFPRAEAYGASKAALSYLARSLRGDWQPHGIGVGLIEPGFVDTPLTRKNDFAMPTLMPVAEAAWRIVRAIDHGALAISFPRRLMVVLRILQLLPASWQCAIARRMAR